MSGLGLSLVTVLGLALAASLFTPRRPLQVGLAISIHLGFVTLNGWLPDAALATCVAAAVCALLLLLAWDLAFARIRRRFGLEGAIDTRSVWSRHVTGTLPLWWSLANGGLVLFVILVLVPYVDEAPLEEHTRFVSSLIVARWLAAYVLAVWFAVGLWLNGRRMSRTRRWHPGAWFARGLAALTALMLLAFADIGLAVIREFGPKVLGPPERSAYRLRVLRRGTELEVRGRLAFGVTEDVRQLLRKTPGIRVLHLISEGGWMVEGRALANLARSRGLVTYVPATCTSACVIAFAGGKERVLGASARLGLHQPSAPGQTSSERLRGARKVERWLVASGVDEAFAQRAMRCPPEEMCYPTQTEVLKARLATRGVRPGEVAMTWSEAALKRLDLTLREAPLLEFLFEYERPLFDRVVEGIRAGHEEGLSWHEAVPFLQPELDRILAEGFTRAGDEETAAWVRGVVREWEDTSAACVDIEAGWAGSREFREMLTAALRSARKRPNRPPNPARVERTLSAAHRELLEVEPDYAEVVLEAGDDPESQCWRRMYLYTALAEMPVHLAGPAMRHLVGEAHRGRFRATGRPGEITTASPAPRASPSPPRRPGPPGR